jgi:hypothetical protein
MFSSSFSSTGHLYGFFLWRVHVLVCYMLERQNDIDYGGAIKEKEREGIVISHIVAYFAFLLFYRAAGG